MKSQAEAEPWEALDVDDSELPSFLRPCKRKSPPPPPPNPNSTLNGSPSNRQILRRCSSRSSETLTLQLPSDPVPPSAATPSLCLIPGPAGAVQAAMRRKVQKDPSSFGEQGNPIPTQEYIRRVVEEPDKEDEDFSRDPWISAVDYIRSEGLLGDDGVSIGTPVSVIKSRFCTWGKVNQVLAIVKTCTPNGLGDLIVTLKDPTGTIDASIHRRGLAESDFGKDIRVGAVLILKKVAVCTPSRLSCYVNITLNNISKVITEDTLPSLKQNNPARSVKDPAPVVGMPPKAISLDRGKTEGIMNNIRQKVHTSGEQDSTTAKPPQEKHGNGEDVAIDFDSANWQELLVDEQLRMEKQVGRSHRSHHSRQGNDTTSCDKDATVTKVDKTQPLSISSVTEVDIDKTQPLESTSSVPQWTDEQLDELFAF